MKKLLTVALAASMILAMSVNSFALGNYVLSTDELGTEEETPVEEQTPEVQKPAEETVPEETDKPNPDTGTEDFVGVAAAAAVVAAFVRPLIPKSIPLGSNLQAFPYFFLSVKISIRKNFSFPFTIFLLFSSHPFRVVSYF